jgi:hypothetical protein
MSARAPVMKDEPAIDDLDTPGVLVVNASLMRVKTMPFVAWLEQ